MIGCPRCKFISDPLSGDIYDPTFPCPRCGNGGAKPGLGNYPRGFKPGKSKKPGRVGFAGLGDLSFFSRVTSVAKLAGIGAAFYFSRKTLNEIEAGETNRDRKIRSMLGEMLPALQKSTFYIPAYALPHALELATNTEYPILGTVYALGVSYMLVKTAAGPILQRVDIRRPRQPRSLEPEAASI